jgi:RNA recognition motif-containing protein
VGILGSTRTAFCFPSRLAHLLGSFVCPFLFDPESIQRVEKPCDKENLVGKKL